MRDVIIGDIHGCCDAFVKLLDIIKPDPSEDTLILLGDLFDRGPDSWDVFQKVKELDTLFGNRLIIIRGNHEDYLLQDNLSFSLRRVWERVGKGATVKSFKTHSAKMEDSIPWLKEHTKLFHKEENFWCVHAGLEVVPPEKNDPYTLMHDHDIVLRNKYNGPLVITGHIALKCPVFFKGDGQTIAKLDEDEWNQLPSNGTICIDTGCGKGGCLTGMIVENGMYMLRSALGKAHKFSSFQNKKPHLAAFSIFRS